MSERASERLFIILLSACSGEGRSSSSSHGFLSGEGCRSVCSDVTLQCGVLDKLTLRADTSTQLDTQVSGLELAALKVGKCFLPLYSSFLCQRRGEFQTK